MKGQNDKYMDEKAAYLQHSLLEFGIMRTQADDGVAHAHIANMFEHAGTETMDLAPNPNLTVRDNTGTAIAAVRLNRFAVRANPVTGKAKAEGMRSKPIAAYYLPFRAGQGHTMVLGTRADYFFTPTLNGCTFVCGTDAQNPRVSHLNLQTPTAQIDQVAMDAMLLRMHGAYTQFVVRRADYKPAVIGATEDYQAMVVGFRGTNGWKFHIQKFKVDFTNVPHVYTLNQVQQLN